MPGGESGDEAGPRAGLPQLLVTILLLRLKPLEELVLGAGEPEYGTNDGMGPGRGAEEDRSGLLNLQWSSEDESPKLLLPKWTRGGGSEAEDVNGMQRGGGELPVLGETECAGDPVKL